MTKGQVLQMIGKYRTFLAQTGDRPEVHPNFDFSPTRGESIRHLLYMCDQVEEMLKGVSESLLHIGCASDTVTWEKVMRWLGFMQGVLWFSGNFTLNELREHNVAEVK